MSRAFQEGQGGSSRSSPETVEGSKELELALNTSLRIKGQRSAAVSSGGA
jgi:hypothetical protein